MIDLLGDDNLIDRNDIQKRQYVYIGLPNSPLKIFSYYSNVPYSGEFVGENLIYRAKFDILD